MRALFCLLLVGCGMPQDTFEDRLDAAVCDWKADCFDDAVDPETCVADAADSRTPTDCAYDPKAGRDCARGVDAMECPYDGEEVLWPAACALVWDCG